jgi:hypothetical protein
MPHQHSHDPVMKLLKNTPATNQQGKSFEDALKEEII